MEQRQNTRFKRKRQRSGLTAAQAMEQLASSKLEGCLKLKCVRVIYFNCPVTVKFMSGGGTYATTPSKVLVYYIYIIL